MTDTPVGAAPGSASTADSGAAEQPHRLPDGVLATISSLWRDLPGLFNDRVELLSLEMQRAGIALVQIVMLIVVIAILGATAWLALWAGVIVGLVALGLPLALALLVGLVLNAVAAAIAVARVRGLLPMLKFPATRRHLMFSPSTEPQTEPERTSP